MTAPPANPSKRGLPVWAWILLSVGGGLLCLALALVGSCVACTSALQPGELVYHAHAGACWLDVVYLDSSGEEIRRGRVRGPTQGMTNDPWTTSVDLGTSDRFKVSVIPAESCMREPECWVTYRGAEIHPRTSTRQNPDGSVSALCEGTVP